ncbi:MAG: hypothetical protein Q8P18_29400 [Pseudomonadota bacterium]|nr:hypothetical protein [Pseudomonadota bacterium]
MLALVLAQACAGSDVTDTGISDTAPSDTAPSDTGSAGLVAPAPTWDATTAASHAQTLLDPGLPDAVAALENWRDLFAGIASPCPNLSGNFSIASAFEGCLATDGRTWAGYAVYTEAAGSAVDVQLEADAYVTLLDGTTFLAAGKTYLTIDETGAFSSTVVGTWGGTNLPDWTGPRPSVAVYATGGPASATFYGGISLDQDAVYISGGAWDAESCRGATGEVDIRDPGGWWYALTLDADCSGCGEMRYEDEELGRACLDLEPLLAAFVGRMVPP